MSFYEPTLYLISLVFIVTGLAFVIVIMGWFWGWVLQKFIDTLRGVTGIFN